MSEVDEVLLRCVMDATASLWNELTYERRQNFFDGESVWETEDYRKRYVGVIGSVSAQQTIRKSDQAWRGFFDSDGPDKGLPGYWGNEDEGRDLHWFGRNDQYTIQWGDRSRLEIPVGKDLKDEYDFAGRLRLEVAATRDGTASRDNWRYSTVINAIDTGPISRSRWTILTLDSEHH